MTAPPRWITRRTPTCAAPSARWKNPPTTFIVSQRVASVRFADQIIVLDDGRVAGMGTHDELLAACPVYQEIYASQFKKGGTLNGQRQRKNPPSPRGAVMRRVLRYIGPHVSLVVLSLALCLISVALTLYVPILVGRAVDCIVGPNAVDFAALKPILLTIAVCIVVTAAAQVADERAA